MRKINLIWIVLLLTLVVIPYSNAQQSQVDTFVRANNAALGTATNGNLWGETGEGASGSFQILNNAERFTSSNADQSVYADLNLSTTLTQDGEYIRFNARPNTAGAGLGVIQIFNSLNVLVFDLFYQLEDNANDCLYNKTIVYTAKAASQESCLFGSNDDANPPKPANITLYMNFTAQTISVELKNSSVTARNVSARMRGTSIQNIAWIRIGRGGTISGGTIDILNITQFNIAASPPPDNSPSIKASINNTPYYFRDLINITINATDDRNLSYGQISFNDTGTTRFFNFTINGTNNTQFFQNFTLSCAPCVINMTAWVNDTAGQRTTYTNITSVLAVLILNSSDTYDGPSISNFSTAFFQGSTLIQNTSTTNGMITIGNLTRGFYNLSLTSTQSSGYFGFRLENINLSGQTLTLNFTQAYINLNVTDLLTGVGMTSFSVSTNRSSYAGTNGYINIPLEAGFFLLNITSGIYPLKTITFYLAALQNTTYFVNLSPQFSFNLRREADDSVFDIMGTNTTKLTIYCPTKNIVIYFKNSSATSRNSTQENITMDCDYSLMKMDIIYDDSSYFRTLIPPFSQTNVTWWLLDLNQDIGVQKILELVDLTGDWSGGILRIKRAIGQFNQIMIAQYFDVSTATNIYLLKDALYTVTLENEAGTEERQLGSLIADTAGTVTITYPNLPFYPEDSVLEDDISWDYTFNTTSGILRLQYVDLSYSTTLLTWDVYNGTNSSDTRLLQTFTSTTNGTIVFTYQPVAANQTYYTYLFAQSSLLDYNITQGRVFGNYEQTIGQLGGFTATEEANIQKFGSGLFLIVWGFLFSYKHAGIGLGTTFIWTIIFKQLGWFPISYVWISLIGFVAILSFIVEAMRKN